MKRWKSLKRVSGTFNFPWNLGNLGHSLRLRRMDTFSKKAFFFEIIWHPSEKGSTQKGNYIHQGIKFFRSKEEPFLEGP